MSIDRKLYPKLVSEINLCNVPYILLNNARLNDSVKQFNVNINGPVKLFDTEMSKMTNAVNPNNIMNKGLCANFDVMISVF